MDNFLDIYKELETTVRNTLKLQSVKEYEDILVNNYNLKDIEDKIDKLRLARTIRNYYAHHTDGESLIKVNKTLIDLLKLEIDNINNSKLQVKL